MARQEAKRKAEKYRFAQNVEGEETVAEREYRTYAGADPEEMTADADVLLDVPVVKVDSIHLKVAKLEAHVALKAEVFDLVRLNVGVDVELGKLQLDLKGVEAQALVKVRLDHVAAIVDRVMTTVDRNPDLLESVGQAVEDVGSGAGDAIGESGEAVDQVGRGAEGALQGALGQGAGQAVGQLGQGAGQAAGGVEQLLSTAQDAGELSGGQVAKVAAKAVAKEIGSAASDEAKDLGVAATRKIKELGERRRDRRARKHNATPAAERTAEELGVDLEDIEGSGAEGRITVQDVRQGREIR